ncbi:MAG: hypothetical protein ACOX6E_03835 [Syntrophomonadaceae bacterium]|jgi:hypothetical protein
MRPKKYYIPRPVLKTLAENIKNLIKTNEGRLSLLDIIEEIPFNIRPQVAESLSIFHEQFMVNFYYLLKAEYGNELAVVCDRALEKCRMVGMDISPTVFFKGKFIKTYASITRHTGHMTLEVAWDTGGSGVHVEAFYISFNPDGINSFMMLPNKPLYQFERDRKYSPEFIILNFEETCYLLQEAFSFNVAHMTKPALGRFMYQKYLEPKLAQSYEWIKELIRKTSARLTPRQVINSFFRALSQNDIYYIFSLLSEQQNSPDLFYERFAEILNPEATLLEGEAKEVQGSRNTARVKAQTIKVENQKFFSIKYSFYMLYESGCWCIGDIERFSLTQLDPLVEQSPLNTKVYCRVYEIVDMEELFEILDRIDNIRECEELPCGSHLQISYNSDDFNHGVSFMSGVIADIIINGGELVVITQTLATMLDIDKFLNSKRNQVVINLGEYEVNLFTAYTYLGGQFSSFEELLIQDGENNFYDDGMRFITNRYLIKDYDKVVERLENLKTMKIKLDNDSVVYYQIEKENGNISFFVEYLLEPNWISISTLSEHDMSLARQAFEEQMYDYLEFDGMEVRNEGLFDVLTTDIKREYPDLEAILKEIYLDKWFNSHLIFLSGMSPSEACQTEEGSRLLWALFKNLKRKNQSPYFQYKKSINLKEYIRKVEQKKELNNRIVY